MFTWSVLSFILLLLTRGLLARLAGEFTAERRQNRVIRPPVLFISLLMFDSFKSSRSFVVDSACEFLTSLSIKSFSLTSFSFDFSSNGTIPDISGRFCLRLPRPTLVLLVSGLDVMFNVWLGGEEF